MIRAVGGLSLHALPSPDFPVPSTLRRRLRRRRNSSAKDLYRMTCCQGFLTPSFRNSTLPNLIVFPDRVSTDLHQDPPAETAQCVLGTAIPRDVLAELLGPELDPALRRVRVPASLVAVPETAMHQHDDPIPRKHEIRPARQILAVQAESESQAMCRPADDQLRDRIPALDAGHHLAASRRVHNVHGGVPVLARSVRGGAGGHIVARRPRPIRGCQGGVQLVRIGEVGADAFGPLLDPVDEELREIAANARSAGWGVDLGRSCGRETEHVRAFILPAGDAEAAAG